MNLAMKPWKNHLDGQKSKLVLERFFVGPNVNWYWWSKVNISSSLSLFLDTPFARTLNKAFTFSTNVYIDPGHTFHSECRVKLQTSTPVFKSRRKVPQADWLWAPVDCSISQRGCFHTSPSGDAVQKQGPVRANVCEHNKHTLMQNRVTKISLKRRESRNDMLYLMIPCCHKDQLSKYIIWCYTFSYLAVLLRQNVYCPVFRCGV